MAGWMRIITPILINAYPGRILNIHPSLLPNFKGLNAIDQALSSGTDITGCTVHFVTDELDSGPIINQVSVPIHDGDNKDILHRRIQDKEHLLLPIAVAIAGKSWRNS